MKNIINKNITSRKASLLMLAVMLSFSACGEDSPTVIPAAVSQSVSSSDAGTLNPRVVGIYPENGDTGIPVDTDIIIVFSKPVQDPTIIPANITITDGTTTVTGFSKTYASDNKTVILSPTTPLTLPFGAIYTVSVSTLVTDADANPLNPAFSSTFTTAADNSALALPRVIAASRFPAAGATGVSENLSFVEVTFSRDMDLPSITTASFAISPFPIGTTVSQINSKTYRLNFINPLSFATPYTITLNTSNLDQAAQPLVINADASWTFTTENDPAIAPVSIDDIWVDSITALGAVINFTTSEGVAPADCYVLYSTTPGITLATPDFVQESLSPTPASFHSVTIPAASLTESGYYYVRAGINTAGGIPVEILSIAEIGFRNAAYAAGGVNTPLTVAGDIQNGLVSVQTNGAGSYVFWVSNESGNLDIYGQFFNAAAGAPQWTNPGGSPVVSPAGSQSGIVAVGDRFTDALLVYNDTNSLYAKMVYDSAGLNFRWGGGAAVQGTNLGIAIKANSSYSACLVHERPDLIANNLTADMPDNGAAANLLYDADVNFSAYPWLSANDLLLTSTGGIAWNDYAIDNQTASPSDIFPYVLKSTAAAPLLGAVAYYIADIDTVYTGTADAGSSQTELRSFTDANFLNVNIGDIIRNNSAIPDEWGIALSDGSWDAGGYFKIYIDRNLATLNSGVSYSIYTNCAGTLYSVVTTQAAGAADSGTIPTELRSATNVAFLSVSTGDTIYNVTDNTWGIATGPGVLGAYYSIPIAGGVTSLSDGDNYIIYTKNIGTLTSEVVTNPLWDRNPLPLFNPAATVVTGDVVVKNNITSGVWATVVTTDPSLDTDYALRLSADIMNNGDVYAITGLPSGATLKGAGYNTALADFQLTDINASFTGTLPWLTVAAGDVVYNIDADLSAEVISVTGATQLTLSADIFNALNNKYIIYTKRAFLASYIDAADNVMARTFNIANGTAIGTSFAVCTNGVNSAPVAVSDEAGNAIIFYQKSGNIYAKKVSAKGEFFAAWGVNADQASDAGVTVLSGYTIVQALPDRALNAAGGAYLLAKNTAGTAFRLVQISGTAGTNSYDSLDVAGKDAAMAVDSVTGFINRAVVVYRASHLSGVNTYYHIEARAYRSALLWGPVAVTSNTAAYDCVNPSITMADNTAAADNFYTAWFDGRNFSPTGYSLFAQRYTAVPAAQWAANGVFIATPTSKGYDNALSLKLLYWNDAAAPYGLLPLWLDYRNSLSADIYYQKVNDAAVFVP